MAVRIVAGRKVTSRMHRAIVSAVAKAKGAGVSVSPTYMGVPTAGIAPAPGAPTPTPAPPVEKKTYGTVTIGGKEITFAISPGETEVEARQVALEEALKAERREPVTPVVEEEKRLIPKVEVAPAMITEYKPRTEAEIEAEKKQLRMLELKTKLKRARETALEYLGRISKPIEAVPPMVGALIQRRPTPKEVKEEIKPRLFPAVREIFGERIPVPEETMFYREPKIEEVRPLARLELRRREEEKVHAIELDQKVRQKQKELVSKHSETAQKRYNRIMADLRIQVERGTMNVEEANRKLTETGDKILKEETVKAEKEAKRWLDPKIKEYEKKFGKREAERVKKYELEQSKYYLASTIVAGVTFGAITRIPVIGTPILAIGLAKTGLQAPEIVEYGMAHPTALGIQAGASLLGFITGRAGISAIRRAFTQGIKPTVSQSLSVDKAIRIRDLGRGLSLWKVRGAIKTIVKDPKTGKVLSKTRTIVSSDVSASTKAGAIKSYIQSKATSIRESLRTKVKVKFTRDRAVGEFKLKSADVERLYAGGGELFIQQYAKGWITPKGIFVKYKPGEVYRGLVSEWVKAGKPKDIAKFLGKRHGYEIYLTGRESKIIYSALVDLYKGKELTAIQRGKIHGVARAFVPDITKTVPGVGAGEWFVRLKPLPKRPIVKVPDILKDITKIRKVTRPRVITKVPKVKLGEVARVTAKAITKGIAEKIVYEIPKVKPKLHLIQSSILGTAIIPEARITEQMRLSTELISGTRGIQISKQQLKMQQKAMQSSLLGIVPVEAQALKQRQATQLKLQMVQQLIAPGIGVPSITPTIVMPKIPPGIPLIKPRLEWIERYRRRPRRVRRRLPRRAYQPSIGAVALGWAEPEEYIKQIEKTITGFELRPMVKEPSIEKQYLQLQQQTLIAPAYYQASPKEKYRLIAQQRELDRRMKMYAKYHKVMLQKQQLELTHRFIPLRGKEKRKYLKLVKEGKTYFPKKVKGKVKLDIFGIVPLTKRGAKEAKKYNQRISRMLGYTAPTIEITPTKTKAKRKAKTKAEAEDYATRIQKMLIG